MATAATRAARTTRAATSPADELRRLHLAAEREKHEAAFYLHVARPLHTAGYPLPQAQVALIPHRRYRYDFCYIAARLAVEVQGQIWHKGGHTSGYGVTRDAAKANELAAIGWRLLIFTPEQIASGEAYGWTARALRAAGIRPHDGTR